MSVPAETEVKGATGAAAVDLHDHLYVLLRRRRLILGVFVLVTASAALHAFLGRDVYQGQVQILVEHDTPQVLTFKEVSQVGAEREDYYQTQYKLLQSRALARRTLESLNLLADPEFGGPRTPHEIEAIRAQPVGQSPPMERAINAFVGRLTVTPVRNSRLVLVSFQSYRPELAAQAANELARLYIMQALEFRYQTSAEATQWLETQIADQRRKVAAAEVSLEHVKEQEGIVNLEERRSLLEQKLKELGSAFTTLKTERLQKEALYRQMQGTPNPEELPEVMSSPLIQSLRIELAALERQQAQLLELYVERHPEVIKVRNQIHETRTKIAGEAQRVIRAAENDYKAVAAQETSIASALDAAKAEAVDLARRGVRYDSLKKELDANKDVLNSLLSRAKQTDVVQELTASNIRVVDPAVVPAAPIRPKRRTEVLLGLLLGLGAGIGLALFLDYLDNTLKTPDDVQTHLGTPLLGVIPEQQDNPGGQTLLLGARTQQGPFAEGYRVLRTALTYSWPETSARIILVTSTGPEEGKTLTSVNTALMLASMDSKVLLIDADLRKPMVHALLRARKSPGLSDVLVGKTKPSEAIVLEGIPGTSLSVLPSGTHAPSPAELMTGRTMRGLLDGLRAHYQWIVVDSPPVGPVTEPLILAPHCDGVVLVAGAEMIPRKAVLRTIERIEETGARVLGVVLNRAQIEKHSYYYAHYYGHYYGRYHSSGGTSPRKVASISEKRAAS